MWSRKWKFAIFSPQLLPKLYNQILIQYFIAKSQSLAAKLTIFILHILHQLLPSATCAWKKVFVEKRININGDFKIPALIFFKKRCFIVAIVVIFAMYNNKLIAKNLIFGNFEFIYCGKFCYMSHV